MAEPDHDASEGHPVARGRSAAEIPAHNMEVIREGQERIEGRVTNEDVLKVIDQMRGE